jgi:hypothetical protein
MASHPSQHQPSRFTSKSAPYLLRTHPRGCLQLARRKLGVLTPRPRQPRRRVGSCLPRLPNRWLGIRAGSPRHSVCRLPHGDGHVGRAPSGARPLPPSDYLGCGTAIIAPRGHLRFVTSIVSQTEHESDEDADFVVCSYILFIYIL